MKPTYNPKRKPVMLTGRWVDIPLFASELEAVAALAPQEKRTPSPSSGSGRSSKRGRKSVEDRAAAYVSKMEPSIAGQHGHDRAFAAACALMIGFELTIEQARPIYLAEFNSRCEPPWSDAEVDHKLEGASSAEGERGYLLKSDSFNGIESREIVQLDYSQNLFEPIDHVELPEPPVVVKNADSNASLFCPFDAEPIVDEDDPLASISILDIQPVTTETAVSTTVSPTELAMENQPLATVRMEWLNPRTQDGRTDIANAKRLASMIRGRAHYVTAWESWIVWDGKRWREDDLAIYELAKEIPGTIIAAAISPPPIDANACNWAFTSSSKSRIVAMISLAKSEPGIPIEHTELDSNPWLLNCQNGTVDLRTGELLPHDQANKITRIASVNYNPDAETYEWDRFLEKILIDDGLIKHVQRLIGYCITGSTREQVLPIFWGEGSNGKSTLLDTLKLALGVDYASTAPPSLIMQKKHDAHPTELAGLCGKRMVTAIETEKNQRLNEPLVKQLTGSDSISARRMRENFWEFRPTHKIVLCTNHEPRVGDDFAIWRRLTMVPFMVQFWNPDKGETGPEELRRDNDLPKRLENSLEGVLAWAVQGSIEWYKSGLGTDQTSKTATEEYRKRQDQFGRFVEEVCVINEHVQVRFGDLYDQYGDWVEENGERRLSQKAFGEWLAKKKFEKRRSGGIWICGITWKPEFDKTNNFDTFNA